MLKYFKKNVITIIIKLHNKNNLKVKIHFITIFSFFNSILIKNVNFKTHTNN